MSMPPPPGPSLPSVQAASMGIPPGATTGSVPTQASAGKPRNASPIPIIVALLIMVISGGLIFMADGLLISMIGYVLTPVVVAGCLAWDSLSQRHGMQDVWFSPRPRYGLTLRILVAVSFLVSYPHIHEISAQIAERLTAAYR